MDAVHNKHPTILLLAQTVVVIDNAVNFFLSCNAKTSSNRAAVLQKKLPPSCIVSNMDDSLMILVCLNNETVHLLSQDFNHHQFA